jgi:hypothetical protein
LSSAASNVVWATLIIGIGAGLVGWLLQALMVMNGWRRHQDPEAADYTEVVRPNSDQLK